MIHKVVYELSVCFKICKVPTDLESCGEKMWSGKSPCIYFLLESLDINIKKSGEFFKILIALKVYCYSCLLSRMFVTIFPNNIIIMSPGGGTYSFCLCSRVAWCVMRDVWCVMRDASAAHLVRSFKEKVI